jgi:hypothetical protein
VRKRHRGEGGRKTTWRDSFDTLCDEPLPHNIAAGP